MRAKAILLFVATVAFALGPFMVPAFQGFDPGLYPVPQVDPPVQPAGYAFAIWGVIYLWLILSAGFGLLRRADSADWDRHRLPLLISLVIGVAWLPVAVQSAVWATVLIFAMLLSAAWALALVPAGGRWWGRAPVALYAGWLTAASFASLGMLGAGYGIGPGEIGWAYICIVLALVTALIIHGLRRDEPVYFLSAIWALVAIAVKNWGAVPGVAWLALAGAAALALLAGVEVLRPRGGPARP